MKPIPQFKKNLKSQKSFSADELLQKDTIEQEAIANFTGDLGDLESALGMLTLGHQYGWRVIYLIHSKATVKKYEKVLGITIRNEFNETEESSTRSNAFRIVQKLSNFWKAASGESGKIPNKRLVD